MAAQNHFRPPLSRRTAACSLELLIMRSGDTSLY
ncbi:hypothetical protein C2U63_01830 [Burkholderia pseudomallei]|nr:hypothetical protein CXQ84_12385 [Burkholderia pseudomallei]QBI43315.1 hypothetical protein EXY28_27145 [Burkholderia pseudomallei]QBI49993.1 hypothetical protein EXY72_27205 [Burkholderia pseudomallei]QBP51725.1 hypothetical protein E2R28_26895 [Burkholderia pseudomallei]QBP58399.1 hypothetical protein E2R23_27155 [Burkholderia pseudomallei]